MDKLFKVDFEKYKILPKIKKLLETGELSLEELERLNAWKEFVEENGYEGLHAQSGWGDVEEKTGKYKGYRSSLLGVIGKRIIYEVIKHQGQKTVVIVAVFKVDTKYYE